MSPVICLGSDDGSVALGPSVHRGPSSTSVILIAAVVGLAAAAATFAVSSNLFDGGTDEGNRLAALGVGSFVLAGLIIVFTRQGMPAIQAAALILVSWALTAGLVVLLYAALISIACSAADSCLG